MERRHVIILGGGVAGLLLARRLAGAARRGECALTLLDAHPNLTFAPLLPAVATGHLRPDVAEIPLAAACERLGVQFVQGEVTRIDAPRRSVVLSSGIHRTYDRLVCALGADRGADAGPDVWTQTTAQDARRLHLALLAPGPDGHLRDVLMLGEGLAAVSMARAIAAQLPRRDAHVVLASASARLLPEADENARRRAETALADAGVRVHRHAHIADGDIARRLDLRDPIVISLPSGAPRSPLEGWPWPTDAHGALSVNPAGEVLGAEDVWAVPTTLSVDDLLPVTRVLARNLRRTLLANGAARAGAPLPAPRNAHIGGGLTLPVLLGLVGPKRAMDAVLQA